VVLQQEMNKVVQKALTAWKERDLTGSTVTYSDALPWAPVRSRGLK